MGFILLALMIGVPIVEIAVFIEVGGRIGLWPTVGTVVMTAIFGTALLRQQGLATLYKAQESLQQNRFPLAEVFDGLCLLFAGALLLTPGFVTDAVGFLLFVPPLRALLRHYAGQYLAASGHIHMHAQNQPGPGPDRQGPDTGGSTIIDADYYEVDPNGAGPGDNDDSDPPPAIGNGQRRG